MEHRGFVERENFAEDGRGIMVRLTASGRRVLERAAPGHVRWVQTHFTDVATRKELDALTAVAQRVVQQLNEAPERDASAAAPHHR